jgi:hypothetical protein
MNTTTIASPNLDLDEQASANWILFPPMPESNVIYGGANRDFESVANAVRFVMEKLPVHQRGTAAINTDSGKTYKIDDIEAIYRKL